MRFKPGDAIVVVSAWARSDYANGNKGTVKARNPFRIDMAWWVVVFESGLKETVDENEMEHAEVVASPLWRALT